MIVDFSYGVASSWTIHEIVWTVMVGAVVGAIAVRPVSSKLQPTDRIQAEHTCVDVGGVRPFDSFVLSVSKDELARDMLKTLASQA